MGLYNSNPAGIFEQKKSTTSPREIVMKYLPYLPWIIAICILFLAGAFIKLRYSPDIYDVTGTILVKDPNPYASKSEKFDEVLFTQPNRNINDEIQVIRSRNLAKRVVKSLGLEVQYANEGKIRSTKITSSESPVKLNVIKMLDTMKPFVLKLTMVNDKQYQIDGKDSNIDFDQPFQISKGSFSISRTAASLEGFISRTFIIDYQPEEFRARQLVTNLSAAQSGESNNIIKLTYKTENVNFGMEVVNKWMLEYQQSGLEDKRQTAVKALNFIDDQMDTVKYDLGGVEKHLLGYREKNRMINPQQQSEQFFESVSELEKELTKQRIQLQIVDNIINYIADNRNPYRQVGSVLGIEEPTLVLQINEFNKLQVQRETLLKSTTRANPMMIDLETSIEKLRTDILQNMRNVRNAYELSLRDISGRNTRAGQEISKIPSKEKALLDITRRQKILEELYSYLLQKKLETSISSASTISNVRVIEPAQSTNLPVSPNRKGIYTIAFFLGMLIPSVVVFLIDFLNDKVKSREDIGRVTNAPIVGEVGHSDEKGTLVVDRSSRKFIAEQFRIIRTNLQYILPKSEKSVIMITSSFSGEGKSFISTNMGAVMALAGKKTAIMEFDIRKPKILKGLAMPKQSGITNFIIGDISFEELIMPVSGFENLYIIPCGPVPPNPSELLLNPRMDLLMKKVKEEFDVVVIDTAPLGLVSDAVTLSNYVDSTLFVVRNDFTQKNQLKMIEEVYRENRLPRLCLVINDIKIHGGYGKYYGYGGYGYSSYGYGSEYFDNKNAPKNIWQRFLALFRQ